MEESLMECKIERATTYISRDNNTICILGEENSLRATKIF
jgi:hypothetical protein